MPHYSHRRGAFSVVEVLIAVTIISISVFPVFYMGNFNVETARVDRLRVLAESICHSTLERFGRAEDRVDRYLSVDPSDSNQLVGADIWTQDAELAEELKLPIIAPTLNQAQMHMTVTLRRSVGLPEQRLDALYCQVTWFSTRERKQKPESVMYARLVAED